jgi:hypothetical protein
MEEIIQKRVDSGEFELVGEGSHGKVMSFGDFAVKKYRDEKTMKREATAMVLFKHPCVVEYS